jgi:hypothetical protein
LAKKCNYPEEKVLGEKLIFEVKAYMIIHAIFEHPKTLPQIASLSAMPTST